MSSFEHIADFKQTMVVDGITPPDTINADGQIHRYGIKKNSWYVFHEGDISGGAFGDWKLGVNQTWCSKQASQFNQAEREAWTKQQADIAAKVKAETLAKQAEAAKKGIYLWSIARADVDLKHAYLAAKGIYPHGVKQLGQALLIPVYGQDKQLTGCQFIYPTGDKRFITGTKKKGSFHCLKPLNFEPTDTLTIYITEGYSTGVSVFMAMQGLVFIALDKGNLKAVAMFVRSKYPQALIVICGDNDADGGGQQAAIEAAKAVNGLVVIPSGFKDFNDLHQAQGLEVVSMTIDTAIVSKKAAPSDTEDAAHTTEASNDIVAGGFNHGEPLPIRQRLANVMPFNADLLPDSLRDYVLDEADRMPCPPDFVATALVTAIGAVTGAGCGIKPKQKDDWLIVPNFWGGGIAPPTSKKTPAIDAGIKPLDRLIVQARESYENDLKAYEKEMMLYKANVEGLESDLKSASKTSAKNKVKHTPQELVELICQAKENEPQPPILRRYKTNDCTIERLGELERDNPNGVLVLRDELIGLLASLDKEGREGDRAFYLEGFNGTGSYDTDRIMRGNIFIENHCLSVFGGIQPDKLIAYLEQANSGLGNDGLLQRFQLLVYPDPIEWQYRDRYPNKEAANAVFEIFKRLSETDFIEFGAYSIDDYNKRPYFRFTLDAQAFYVEWAYRLNTQKIKQEENSLIQQHLGKYEKLLPALALVFHLVDCVTHHKQGQVSLEAIQKAAAWCEYLETHARRAYGLLLDGGMRSAIALTVKIMQMVKSPTAKTDETPDNWLKHGFVLRDIRRKQWQYLTDDNAIQKALTILSDNYWITSKMQQSTEKGGRPTVRYFISQKLEKANHPTAKTAETQKMYNFDDDFAEKTGFVSFGSTLTGNNENLGNRNDIDLDTVISANPSSLVDSFDLYEDEAID